MRTICLFFSVLFIGSLSAEYDIKAQARAAVFFPSSDRFTKIYGDHISCYELEASLPCWKCLEPWMNLDWLTKKGQSDNLHSFTRISIFNFSFGIKYPYQISDKWVAYAGIGPNLGTLDVTNHMRRYHTKTKKFALGGVSKIGVLYWYDCHLFLDIFFDYLYLPRFGTNMGGSKLGLGIGYRF